MFVSRKWRAKPENAFNFGSLSSPHLASWKFRGTMWRANVFLAEKRGGEAKLMLGVKMGFWKFNTRVRQSCKASSHKLVAGFSLLFKFGKKKTVADVDKWKFHSQLSLSAAAAAVNRTLSAQHTPSFPIPSAHAGWVTGGAFPQKKENSREFEFKFTPG